MERSKDIFSDSFARLHSIHNPRPREEFGDGSRITVGYFSKSVLSALRVFTHPKPTQCFTVPSSITIGCLVSLPETILRLLSSLACTVFINYHLAFSLSTIGFRARSTATANEYSLLEICDAISAHSNRLNSGARRSTASVSLVSCLWDMVFIVFFGFPPTALYRWQRAGWRESALSRLVHWRKIVATLIYEILWRPDRLAHSTNYRGRFVESGDMARRSSMLTLPR